jgi:hypothetical protein
MKPPGKHGQSQSGSNALQINEYFYLAIMFHTVSTVTLRNPAQNEHDYTWAMIFFPLSGLIFRPTTKVSLKYSTKLQPEYTQPAVGNPGNGSIRTFQNLRNGSNGIRPRVPFSRDDHRPNGSKWVRCPNAMWKSVPVGTLWLFNIAMENGIFIDGLPIINGDFPWLC